MKQYPIKKVWCALMAVGTLWCSSNTSYADPSYRFYEQTRLVPEDPLYVIDDDDTHIDFFFGGAVAIDGNVAVLGDAHPTGGTVTANAVTFFRWDGSVWGSPQTVSGDNGNGATDLYGISVDVSGDYAVVGAQTDDDKAADAGAAYVYKYNSTTELWEEKAKLTASNGAAGDLFGCAVTVSGNTIVVGARSQDTSKTGSGMVYVYTTADGGNTWTQSTFFKHSSPANNDSFGRSVSLDGDQLIVGGTGANAGYIFVRTAGTWSSGGYKLTHSGIVSGDFFGFQVDIKGNRAVVTSTTKQKAYVYNKPGGGWAADSSADAVLSPVLSSVTGGFGGTVGLDGDTIVVGDGTYGMATIYKEVSASTWKAVQMQRSSDYGPGCKFGYVAIDDQRILVGSPGVKTAYVYVVTPRDTQSLFASDAAASDNYGVSVAVEKETAVIGASGADAAYVYVRDPSTLNWNLFQILTGSDTAAGDKFGCAVSISGNTIGIGANLEQDSGSTIYGSVYVFTNNGETWSEQQKIRAGSPVNNDRFGTSLAVDGDTLAVGAWGRDDEGTNSGAVYVFTRSAGTWSPQQMICPTALVANDTFGEDLDLYEDTLVVGAVGHTVGADNDAGGVYVFTRSAGTWSQQGGILSASDAAASDNFGKSVSLDVDRLVVGSHLDDDGGSASGSAYVFDRSAGTWSQTAKIVASDAAASDNFGTDVAVFGDEIVVGSPNSNASYRYQLVSGNWSEQEILVGSAAGEAYGISVALGHGNIVAGASINDDEGTDAGRATIISDRTRIPAHNMALWLDGQDLPGGANLPNETRFVANGNGTADDQYFLTKWIDKSFSGNHVYQATTANQPQLLLNTTTSTLPTIDFDGSNDVLAGTSTLVSGSSKRTISMIVRANTTPGATAAFADGGGATNGGRFIVTPEVKVDVTGGSRTYNASTGTTDYRILTVVQTGTDVSSVEAYLDGVKLSQSAVSAMSINTDTGAVSIGAKSDASSAFDGEIAEVVAYSRALNDSERKWLEGYFSDKWLRPAFTRVALHMPEFIDSQTGIVLDEWQLKASDLNSTTTEVVYTLKSVPANGTLKNNGTSLAVNDTFTQEDVYDEFITFDHTGSGTDSHSRFTFTVEGDTGSNGKVYDVVLVRLNEAGGYKHVEKPLFAHGGSIKGLPLNFTDAGLELLARNISYMNLDMDEPEFELMDAAPNSIMTRFQYCNSSSTNSAADAIKAENTYRHRFGIMMTPAGLIDEGSGITSSQTTFKIKQRENPDAPGVYFPLGLYDPTSYSSANDVSPSNYQIRDAILFLRIGDELMKVTDWNAGTRVVTVVRGFGSGLSGARCSAAVAHSNDDPVFSPLYVRGSYPNTASTSSNGKIRYLMDWSQSDGREYHGWAAVTEINQLQTEIPGYQAAIWWDIFGTVSGPGQNCNGVESSKWNTNTNLTEAWDTRFNATHQEKYQQLKIGDVKTWVNNAEGYVPFICGNSYKTEGQRQFLISQTANNSTPVDAMFIEHFDADSRYWMVKAIASQEAGAPANGPAVFAKHLEPGSIEDAVRDRSERHGYAMYLIGLNSNTNCHYGVSTHLYNNQNGEYGNIHQQFFYPVGDPVADYDVFVDLDDPGAPTPDGDDITTMLVAKRYTFPSQYWPGTQVEYRDYDNAVVFANFGGYRTTIELPSYTGPSGTTNQYINTYTGEIVTSWTTSGVDDTNIFLRLKN